jgi:hypothetical protein
MCLTRHRSRGLASAVALAALASTLTGCVERRYTVRTNVPGTLVYVNGEELGPVPASRSFTFYGDREIVLMAPGYQTQRVIQKIDAPLWDNVLTEFFTENLVPFTLRDERDYTYQMVPVESPQPPDLISRGQVLRDRANSVPPPRRGGILGFLGF